MSLLHVVKGPVLTEKGHIQLDLGEHPYTVKQEANISEILKMSPKDLKEKSKMKVILMLHSTSDQVFVSQRPF